MQKIINAVFLDKNKDQVYTEKVYQYDYGRVLRIHGLDLPTSVKIEFATKGKEEISDTRIGITKDGITDVPVPDSVLENNFTTQDYYVDVFVYIDTGDSGQTVKKIEMPVESRPKPEVLPGADESTMSAILEQFTEIANEKVTIPATGEIGQVLSVKSTDESGKPVEFETVNQSCGVSEEEVKQAVKDYLEENPIEETDPTVPDWAKEPEKPSYTASEVGALPVGTMIPSKTSDLENDKGYLEKPSSAQVGQIFKVQSVNEDGTLVLEAVDMPNCGVGDIQINGTSIVGEDGVAVVPILKNEETETHGLVKLCNMNLSGVGQYGDGINAAMTTPSLMLRPASNSFISSRIAYCYAPVTPGNLDYAVKTAMTDGKGEAWTDTEKTGAWSRLSSIKTVMDEVAVAGATYLLGEQTEVSVVLPDDALTGQEITVTFYNGETPATLSITGNMLDFDFTPTENTRSEISCLYDGHYWSVIGMSQDVPVETTEEVVASE